MTRRDRQVEEARRRLDRAHRQWKAAVLNAYFAGEMVEAFEKQYRRAQHEFREVVARTRTGGTQKTVA